MQLPGRDCDLGRSDGPSPAVAFALQWQDWCGVYCPAPCPQGDRRESARALRDDVGHLAEHHNGVLRRPLSRQQQAAFGRRSQPTRSWAPRAPESRLLRVGPVPRPAGRQRTPESTTGCTRSSPAPGERFGHGGGTAFTTPCPPVAGVVRSCRGTRCGSPAPPVKGERHRQWITLSRSPGTVRV